MHCSAPDIRAEEGREDNPVTLTWALVNLSICRLWHGTGLSPISTPFLLSNFPTPRCQVACIFFWLILGDAGVFFSLCPVRYPLIIVPVGRTLRNLVSSQNPPVPVMGLIITLSFSGNDSLRGGVVGLGRIIVFLPDWLNQFDLRDPSVGGKKGVRESDLHEEPRWPSNWLSTARLANVDVSSNNHTLTHFATKCPSHSGSSSASSRNTLSVAFPK